MFDRINALFARLDPMVPEDRAVIQGGLASLRIGLNVIALRSWLPELSSAAAPVQSALTELAEHFMAIARGGSRPVPSAVLEGINRQILALDESALTVRAAESIFSVDMTMRQHSKFFGDPWSVDVAEIVATVSA